MSASVPPSPRSRSLFQCCLQPSQRTEEVALVREACECGENALVLPNRQFHRRAAP
jgi:hypothetical protein